LFYRTSERGNFNVGGFPSLGRKKGITGDLILWRRTEVARLLSRGVSVNAIAERLNVDARTIFEDQRYIRQHANEVLEKYLVETLPIELSKCLSRLNQVSDESWALVDNKQLHTRDRLVALARAESSAINIIKLLTDNKELIYTALGKKRQLSEILNPTTSSADEPKEDEENAGRSPDDSDESEKYQRELNCHEFHSKNSSRDQSENSSQRVF
jgi:hypothetical protein